MKTNLKRLLALLMVLTLLFALVPAAFADEDYDADWDYSGDDGDWDDDPTYDPEPDPEEHARGLIVPLEVYFSYPDGLTLGEGDSTYVWASVQGADESASYQWSSSNSGVVRVSGDGEDAKLVAVGAGHADVSLTVQSGDRMKSASFHVDVEAAAEPVILSGGGHVTLEAGEETSLSASLSGGSGSFSFDWDAFGDAGLAIVDDMRLNAKVLAGRAGTGTVILTVTDQENPSNYDMVSWDFTVTEKPQVTPPEIQMNRGGVDLGAGASASLMIEVSGGTGSFEYIWTSDNSGVVSVSGNGTTAEIRAAETLLPGSNTATISVHVRDVGTGLNSNTATCLVTVSGGSATYDLSDAASVGKDYAMNTLAQRISDSYARSFGSPINYGASVMFESAGGNAGSIRMQDGTAVKAGTSYAFASFQDMIFKAAANGSFSTYYQIVDGGNKIYGTLTISVSGAIGVTSVSLNPTSLRMTTGSNQYLTLSVTPANAAYSVEWTVADGRLLTLAGSGAKITLKSNSNTGSTTVTAVVTDANGARTSSSCAVTVYQEVPYDPTVYYDPSVTVMLGSDYYGSTLSDGMSERFRTAFGVYPGDNATIIFPSLGKSTYGTMYSRNGYAAEAKRTYTFRDFVDMYFLPSAAGTYSFQYQLNYKGNMMQGTAKVLIESSSLNVSLSPTAIVMAPYSSQYISVSISPASAYYRISWASSDNRIATVSGSNTTAVVNSVGVGTATIYVIVTDSRGVEVRRGCPVVVTNSGSSFSPTVSTTLGIPYIGTGASGAMRSQFQSVYGMTLADNAIIRFGSTGNTEVGVMRLSDGSMIRPNTDYTLAQFVAMYTQPVASGTYSVPYTLTYAGKTLNGTVNVAINSASISTDLTLASRNAYWFSDPITGGTGGSLFADSVRNAVGSGWSYIRFGKTSDGTGTLYLDRNYTALNQTTNLTPAMLSQLYFVPGSMNGTFSAPYTVYASNGGVLGTGTLNVNTQGITFSDVPSTAYYAPAVSWAVSRGVTSGTGGSNFSPEMIVTRGQAVTFLWRAAGQPKSAVTANPFTDVLPGAYYYDAVLWAVQQGITNGTSDTTFSPDLPLHRDQLLTFLCRANGGYAGGADWSKLAVDWASLRGLLAGIPGTFVATGDCPRSEVVYYLWKNYNG